jgi:hypothetical protein
MSTSTPLVTVLQSPSEDGLTLRDILSDLPTDPVSLFVVVLVVGSVLLVLWAGRPGGGRGGRRA